ncbi:altronate dehydratase [Arthrospiribacter ruber]|uniref:Altronate dehydratase n=1 Tax=Arthrospiribacter ruber TaxID=2487934 RepID=A0A951IXA9_9BACT|nr:altronate dehydratase family protein [Arthrospiribacter ruber]MBW3467984.1 altronate dehydratase [Arthrospiribacter ruber]
MQADITILKKTIKINPNDNVIVALTDLKPGEILQHEDSTITLISEIPAKHKLTEVDIPTGGSLIMYGIKVGEALEDLPKGSLIHTGNVRHAVTQFGRKSEQYQWVQPDIDKFIGRTFEGYHRSDGQVGTSNYWLVIPLVFCENRNVEVIKHAFLDELGFGKPNPYKSLVSKMKKALVYGNLQEIDDITLDSVKDPSENRFFENLDGIKFLTHQGGCGGTRQDAEMLCALLAGYLNNPNVAGGTVLSLGCQNAQAELLESKIRAINKDFDKPLIMMEQQKEGTEAELLTKAIKRTFLALAEVNQNNRKPAPLSKLNIGLECGGSDGFSGISANPVVGHVSDLLVSLGGTSVLSEFPELCGVEQELINRCESLQVAEKFSQLMKAYAASAAAVGSGFDMNPSPGNIKDGLITDAIKSAGAAKKGGSSPVADVLDYGEYLKKKGLNLLCTPGNDVESTTAMAGSGANIILFTTGLGTPTGNPIAPVIKISSNTTLYRKMPDIIDFNTGEIISGEKSIEECGEELMEMIIDVASGKILPKAVKLGQDDFIPWKRGVSL